MAVEISRRQFLLGTTSMAAAVALSIPPTQTAPVTIGFDPAVGPDATAGWVLETTPGGDDGWVRKAFFEAKETAQMAAYYDWPAIMAA